MVMTIRSYSKITSHRILPWLFVLMLLFWTNSATSSEPEKQQTYIIHMDHSYKPSHSSTYESWHRSTLKSLPPASPTDDIDNDHMLLYSYNHVMHGFSARLTRSQLHELEKSPAHRATYPESFGKLFTTHTTKFLGLKRNSGIWPAASYGDDIIIAIIDTGVWPESESFSDKGMPPIPERWNGKCENGTAFSSSVCNKKLIGARYFNKGLLAAGINISTKDEDYDTARDYNGHGTHTSSTAAGNRVFGASQFGYAKGTARGVAPGARIAMYKVFWEAHTEESAASDTLAAMDQAIADGVDIMSLSFGFKQTPYFTDVIAIASLSAIEKGILVVCAAGNDGPRHNTTFNGAPWIMTVGAGTIDRSFIATMTLGNGLALEGASYFPENVYIKRNAPLYYGRGNVSKATCNFLALNPKEVADKVVFCESTADTTSSGFYQQREEVKRSGALAGIFMTDYSELDPEDYSIPMLVMNTTCGTSVKEYLTAEVSNPTVKSMTFILTKLGTSPAPQVAEFSSRGPDPISPGVLKPDILAPGVEVLAAVPPINPVMKIGNYGLVTDYALYSGTSMAAPHVAGVAALVKAVHNDWSPAAIRSAIMTTAYTIDNTHKTFTDQNDGQPATPLEFGAGHINPNKAMDPGLVYDMNLQDYIDFLCGLGYSNKQMSAVIRRSDWSCNDKPTDLNYPSFVASFTKGKGSPPVKKFSRVVTNVGDDNSSIYHAVFEVPGKMRIRTEPSTLTFTSKYEKQSFILSVEIDEKYADHVTYGYLKWIDQHNHIVSSPIVAILN